MDKSSQHYPNIGTLCFLTEQNKIILGSKQYGRQSGGYNFPGGKVNYSDTSLQQSIIREVKEETGLTINNPVLVSINHFCYARPDQPEFTLYAYKTSQYSGVLKPSAEMIGVWFDIDNLPFDKMWVSDRYWFAAAYADQPTIIRVSYIENKLDSVKIQFVSNLNEPEISDFSHYSQ